MTLIHKNKDYYLNPQIKRTNLSENYTEDEVKEYIRCSQDPEYFIEKYVRINSLDHGFVPFALRGYQKSLIKSFHKNRKVVLLSPRQSGKTITTAAFILWYVFFNPDKTVAILANKAPVAREILARIVAAYETIPFFLQPGAKVLNKGSIELGNNSRIIASATSATAIRGFSVNFLYLDEFGFVENAGEFFKSTFPTISSGEETKIVISSTPNGLNLFHKIFSEAKADLNDFTPFEITWDQVPGRDEKWKKQQLEILGELGFRQEYGNEFLGSANTLISGEKLRELYPRIPIFQDVDTVTNCKPETDHRYVCLVDVSAGKLGDYSTITIIDITQIPYKICLVWKSNQVRPISLSNIIIPICKKYNDAYLVIERNSIGRAVAEDCHYEHEYENLGRTSIINKKQTISAGFSRGSDPGVEVTKTVKRIGCTVLKGLIEEGKIIHLTKDQIFELSNFVSKGDSYSADVGKHDDLVMNLVLFSWLTTQSYFRDMTTSDSGYIRVNDDEDLTPFGAVLNGQENMTAEQIDDVRWLLG